jgi:peptidoglycan biosynthesis protein MviN/MurJ (putative lipid II flippase)
MLINVALAATLVGPLEVRGVALALSLATVLEFVLLYALIARRVPALVSREVILQLRLIVVSTALMALAAGQVVVLLHYGLDVDLTSGTQAFVAVLLTAAAGGLVYFGVSLALGAEEPRLILGRTRGLIRRGGP